MMADDPDIAAVRERHDHFEDAKLDTDFASIATKLKTRTVTFSEKEQEILDTYDALQELRLENAMMEAQVSQGAQTESESDMQALEAAQSDHLEARAAWSVSDNIVKNVLQADPLLKAIHSGENASAMERSLQPLIDQRDILVLLQTNLSTRLQVVKNDLVLVRARNLDYLQKNKNLSKEIVRLGKEAELTADKIEDPALKNRLEVLRGQTKEEKRQYRIIKSLASGIVAGSGFDWAADDDLREIVLDDED